MSDPYNNPYGHYHHQVKANITANGSSQDFSYNVGYGKGPGGGGGGGMGSHGGAGSDPSPSSHLNSLNDCVNRLQTSLNQYLTKIIDECSEGPSNYNLGSGEVLNSHLMEQYSSSGNPGSQANNSASFNNSSQDNSQHNGYSYYSNYPQNYSSYHNHPHHPSNQPPTHQQSPYGMPNDYSHQYPEFQEPKPKKQKSK